jgi:hypothetical protein
MRGPFHQSTAHRALGRDPEPIIFRHGSLCRPVKSRFSGPADKLGTIEHLISLWNCLGF